MMGFVHAHVLCASRNAEFLETHRYTFQAETELGVRNHIVVENGYLQAPRGSGIGIEVDWNFVEKKTVKEI